MSQQQQSQQPPQQPQQPNWLRVTIITAIVGGIVQVIVNHFDSIVAFLAGIFSQIHIPPLQGSPLLDSVNTLASIFTILGALLTLLQFLHPRQPKQKENQNNKHSVIQEQGAKESKSEKQS